MLFSQKGKNNIFVLKFYTMTLAIILFFKSCINYKS